MGNRAVITTPEKKIGVYLHWNGGRDSVSVLLAYCAIKEYRNPVDDCYGWARMCQVIGNMFGGNTSLGIDLYEHLDRDNGDNGVYIIDNDWNIIGREFFNGQEQDYYDFLEGLIVVNFTQPKAEQVEIKTLCDYAMEKQGYTLDKVVAHLENVVREADSTVDREALDAIQKYCNELEASQEKHRKITLINISVEE